MDTKHICSICGKPLAPNAPEGLCPECLLKAGLGTGVDMGPDTGGKTQRFVPPKTDELAAKFPQLEILEFIGQGGMGAVYKTRQKQLDRVVALKILPPQSGGPAFAERFAREARALAKLNHPHIVTLYEFGQSDGLFYFLMEFVDGVNLRQLLANSRISPREALAIVPQICEALQFAHDSGIVHRDIKPENILLDKKGQVKIADFGVAKMIAESLAGDAAPTAAAPGELTEAGSTLGTPQYMAPEQIKNPAEVDHRADIYSLGVVFYQMLTGELPSGKIEPPSRKVHIDVRLDEVVLRALEKKPELRFQQAGDVKTIVETIATTPEPLRPEPPSGFKHYKNSEWNFELDIPEDWNTFPPNRKNSPYEVLRFGSHGNGRHLLIVFLMSSDIFPFKVSLKDLPDRLQKTLTQDMSAWAQKLLAKAGFGNFISGETIIGGKPVRTLDFDRPEGDGTWSCREYFIAEGKLAYVLGFGTTDKARMFETFDRMAKSFQFQPPPGENSGLPTFATSAPPEHLKPFFPKTKTGAANEPKSAPGGAEADPAGYTVRIEPVNPPLARRFGKVGVIALLAMVMAAILIAFLIRAFSIARYHAGKNAATQTNGLVRVPEVSPGLVLNGPPFIAQLQQAAVELAFVGDAPWTNPVCWYPNGRPSPKAFPTSGSEIDSSGQDVVMKKLLCYVRNESTNGISGPICRINDSSGVQAPCSTWLPPYSRMPKGYFGMCLACPSNITTVNLSLGVANGPWETVVSMDHYPSSIQGNGADGNNWSGAYQSVTGTNGDVAVGCTYTARSNWVSRIVYVNDSRAIVSIGETSAFNDSQNPATATLLISSNEYAHIGKFLVQRRPFQWVEFDNVSLQEGHPTTVEVKYPGTTDPTGALPQFQFTARDLAASAEVATNPFGAVVVRFQLTDTKAEAFRAFTTAHLNQPVEIMLGSRVISEPVIRDVISNGQIEQSFAPSQAHTIADLLNGK